MRLEFTFHPESPTPPATNYVGWRGLHWIQEGGRPVAYAGAPAVIPPLETYALPMTEEIQRMSFALMQHLNPLITAKRWHALHGYAVAMNNGAQNGYDGGIPHADYVEGTNLDATLPRYDKDQRTFQGTFIRGDLGYSLMQSLQDAYALIQQMALRPRSLVGNFSVRFSRLVNNNVILCRPGIHGIDANQPMPPVEVIIEKNFYVTAVTAGNSIYNFPQGQGGPVVYPFIFNKPISFRLDFFQRWNRPYLPDPLQSYPDV